MSNSKKYSLISLVVSAIALIGIFIPSLVGIDGLDGGFAISAVCFAVFLIAIICAPVFWWISHKEKGLREGERLAHWTYTDEEWIKFVKMENAMDASFKKTMFLIIVAFAVLCGIGFYIMDPEGGIYVAYAMAGLVVLMGLVALLTTYTAKRRLNKKGEVFISKDGVMVNGQFHVWDMLGSRLEGAAYHQETDPKYIEFEYSYVARYGRQSTQVRVPVPKASENDVASIISKLKS